VSRGMHLDDRLSIVVVSSRWAALDEAAKDAFLDRVHGYDWEQVGPRDRAFIIRCELDVSAGDELVWQRGTYAPDPALEDEDADELAELEESLGGEVTVPGPSDEAKALEPDDDAWVGV
jgi:hypothetical protein